MVACVSFLHLSNMFEQIDLLKCIFIFVVCVVLLIVFNAFIGFCVIFCIYEEVLNVFVYIIEKCIRNVNNFYTNYIL